MLKISANQAMVAINILAQSFADDPMWKFILPNPQNRLSILKAMFKVFVDDGIKRGQVMLAPNQEGAVIWYPSQVNIFDESFIDVEEKLNAIAFDFQESEIVIRLDMIGKKIQPLAPTIPHHEIFWIATLPESRGKGVGSLMLQSILDDADSQNVGCYLVSSNPDNTSFYEYHGFNKIDLISINSRLTLITMWRVPNTLKTI